MLLKLNGMKLFALFYLVTQVNQKTVTAKEALKLGVLKLYYPKSKKLSMSCYLFLWESHFTLTLRTLDLASYLAQLQLSRVRDRVCFDCIIAHSSNGNE